MVNIIDISQIGRSRNLCYLRVHPFLGDFRYISVEVIDETKPPSQAFGCFVETNEPFRFLLDQKLPDAVLHFLTNGKPLMLVRGTEIMHKDNGNATQPIIVEAITTKVCPYDESYSYPEFFVTCVEKVWDEPVKPHWTQVKGYRIVSPTDVGDNPHYTYLRIYPADGDYLNIRVVKAHGTTARASSHTFRGVYIQTQAPEMFRVGLTLPQDIVDELRRGEELLKVIGYTTLLPLDDIRPLEHRIMRASAQLNTGTEGLFHVTEVKGVHTAHLLVKEGPVF